MSAVALPAAPAPDQLGVGAATPELGEQQEPARLARIHLLIPAHNEEAGIVAAMESVEDQTLRPDRRIVVSDNSTDRTVELARSRPGWEVWETVGNRGRKGGALNQAWAILEPSLADVDYVVTMDADTLLDPHFVACAYARYQEEKLKGRALGGICANFSGLPLDSALRCAADDGVRPRRDDQPLAQGLRTGPGRRRDDVLGPGAAVCPRHAGAPV